MNRSFSLEDVSLISLARLVLAIRLLTVILAFGSCRGEDQGVVDREL